MSGGLVSRIPSSRRRISAEAWCGRHCSITVGQSNCMEDAARCQIRTVAPRLRGADGSIAVRLGAFIAFDIQYRRTGNGTWRNWHAQEYPDIAGDGKWTTIEGLNNGVIYEVRIRSRDAIGNQDWSNPVRAMPRAASGNSSSPSVTLSPGQSAQGAMSVTGRYTSPHCRWLRIDAEGLGPGPHNVECWHNAFNNYVHGPWKRTTVTALPDDAACLFGFPGVTVYAFVNGIKTNEIIWSKR